MARSNVQVSQFNPGALQPAGQPSKQQYGVDSGPDTREYIISTPMQGPDGTRYVRQQLQRSDGTMQDIGYGTKTPDGRFVKFTQGAGGQWTEGDWSRDSFGKTVFGDEKLMGFLAIAGGVGALSSAIGAGGAGGAMLGSGTGAPAGVVAGGTSGTAGLAGAGAAASQFGGTADMTPQQLEAMDAGGGGQAGTGQIPAETWQDIATRYGGDVMAWARANPGIAAGILGAAAGYLGNKDDFTQTTTNTTTIDPAIAAYRDQVLGRLSSFGDPNNVPAASSKATNTSPTGLQSSMMNFGGSPTLYAGGTQGFNMSGGGSGPTMYAGGTPGFYNQPAQTGGPTLFRNAAGSPQMEGMEGSPQMQQAQGYTGAMGYNAADNPLAHENNPYLTSMLDSARADMQKYYSSQVAPKFASGSSFGSSGLGFAEAQARDDEAKRFGDVATNLRFQDHSLRSTLQEQLAGRTDAASQFGLNFGRGIWNDTEAQRQFDNNMGRGLWQDREGGRQFDNTMSRGLWQDQEGARTFDLGHARGLWGDQETSRQFNLGHERGLWQDQENARQERMRLALAGMAAPGNTTNTTTQTAQGNPWLGAVGGWLAGSNLWKS